MPLGRRSKIFPRIHPFIFHRRFKLHLISQASLLRSWQRDTNFRERRSPRRIFRWVWTMCLSVIISWSWLTQRFKQLSGRDQEETKRTQLKWYRRLDASPLPIFLWASRSSKDRNYWMKDSTCCTQWGEPAKMNQLLSVCNGVEDPNLSNS